MRPQVELHLKAVRRLLDICSTSHVYLTDGIKRAIFWYVSAFLYQNIVADTRYRQDLNGHVLTGSDRTVGHTTFTEIQWQRDVFAPDLFVLPLGFQGRSHLFDNEFIEVIKDIHALSRIRDSSVFRVEDTVSMMHVDNQSASIQSRLCNVATYSVVQRYCRWAAYLAASMLCCKVWRFSTVPVITTPCLAER